VGIPTMRDRAMQALYLQALDPIAETTADPNSYGFRKERATADAIAQCHIVLSNRGGARWIFEGDIKSCFDRISHEWLMAQIPMCQTILQKWLKAGFMGWRSTSSMLPKREHLRVAYVHQCWRTWRWTAWNGSYGDATRKHRP
jgi:retron-type reverse transcriptase